MFDFVVLILFLCYLGLTNRQPWNKEMEINGKDELKLPLLPSPDRFTAPQPATAIDKKIKTVMFKIGNITCASCATSIESVLLERNGVKSVMVSVLQGQAAVNYVPELITVSHLGHHS